MYIYSSQLVVLGDSNTGKTSLVLRFVEGHYRAEARSATIGAFFLTKRLTVHSITCKMLLWDTAGQAQFQKLAKTYYTTAAAAVLTYDVSQPASIHRLRQFLEEVQRNTVGRRIVIAIAGCKCDLSPAPGLQDEARRLADSVGALYIETSSKNNVGVHDLFSHTAERVLEWQAEAANGTGLPIPVTTGGTVRLPRVQPVSTGLRSSSLGQKPSLLEPILPLNPAAVDKSKDYVSIVDTSTPDTEAEENDNPLDDAVVENLNTMPVTASSKGVMCEGSFLVCGTDDRGCFIM